MIYSRAIVLALLIVPVTVFAFVKPARIVFPKLAGVECVTEWICIDDARKFKEAESLYISSLTEIERKLTKFKNRPKVVFCSSQTCFSAFGFNKAAGKSIGGFGVVIGPRGWKPHYVKHELIHQWQSESYGALSVWMAPHWIIEGMAYSLSDDPRPELSDPFQDYREKYNHVYGQLKGVALKLELEDEV